MVDGLKSHIAALTEEVKLLKTTVAEEVAAMDAVYKFATASSQRVVVARSDLLASLRGMKEEGVESHHFVQDCSRNAVGALGNWMSEVFKMNAMRMQITLDQAFLSAIVEGSACNRAFQQETKY